MRFHCAMLVMALVLAGTANAAQELQSPGLRLKPSPHELKRVALTFDACSGGVDRRIVDVLITHGIRSTVFVTARWLKRNPDAVALFRTHPDLFILENHGGQHHVAIDWRGDLFGVKHAGSLDEIRAEIEIGADAITALGHRPPRWYRGATAWYSPKAVELIRRLGYRLAGYSVAGDGGSLYSATEARRVMLTASDGDVILAHINQPKRPAGEGVAEALVTLKERGFVFVTLDAVP